MVRGAIFFAALLSASAFASVAQATPQDIFGFGARSPGLAFTGVSYSDDYESAFLNPAGLARAKRRTLYLGLSGGGFQLELDDRRLPVDASQGMTIGFTLPLPFGGILEDRLVLGGGFFTPSGVLLEGKVRLVQEPQFNVLERVEASAIQVALGIDMHGVVDGLRIGAGVSVAANVIGNLSVRLDETNSFSSVVETQLVTSFAPVVGATYSRERWGLGLVYRHELEGVMDLAVVASDLPIEVPELNVGGVVHYDPPTLAGEGYFMVTPDLRVALQLNGRFWNAYPGPQRQVTTTSTQAPQPGYGPTLSPRLAAEATFGRGGPLVLDVRGGYAFEPTPAAPAQMRAVRDAMGNPTSELVPARYLDNHRHVLTLGMGVVHEFGDDNAITFDVFTQLHVLQPRTHDIGATDGAPPMKTTGFMLAGGWTFGLEF